MIGTAPKAESAHEDSTSSRTKSHLLETAFALVREMALSELTLRPLAERAAVSVATLTHHFGNKQAVLDALIAASITHETDFVRRWEQTLGQLPLTDRHARARMAGVVFDDWLAHNRTPLLVLLDLLHAPDLTRNGPEVLQRWLAITGPFWSDLLFGAGDRGELALGYVIDEAAFALGQQTHPLYRALRQLCLETLVVQATAGLPANNADAALFKALAAALQPATIPPGTDKLGRRAMAIVEATAKLLTAPVHQSITHRSVARAAGVSAATVVYCFGSTEDLIIAGIYGVIDRFRRGAAGLEQASPTPIADLVRATGVVALASARMPILASHALDMRRRRGENITASRLIEAGAPAEMADDPIFRQIVAIALFGSRRLTYALGGVSDDEAGQAVLEGLLPPAVAATPA